MTATPFPELQILAQLETSEAVGQNLEDAIRYRLASTVGGSAFTTGAAQDLGGCVFHVGDGTISDAIESILTSLCFGMHSAIDPIFDLLSSLFDRIRASLAGLIDGIASRISSLIETVTTRLADAVFAIVDKVTDVVNTIVNTLNSLINTLVAKLRDVVNAIGDIVGAIFNKIGDVVSAIMEKVQAGFNALLQAAVFVWEKISSGISSVIGTLLDVLLATLQRIGDGITAIVEPLVGAAETGLAKVRQVIEDIPTTLREMAAEAQTFVGDAIGKPLANVGDIFITQVEGFFDRLIDDMELSPDKIISDFLTGVGIRGEEADRFARAAKVAMPRTPAVFVIVLALMVPFILPPLVSAILSPAIDEVRQEVAQRITPTLIPPGEVLDAFLRGEIDQSRMRKELGEAGYSDERQDILVRSSRRLLDLGELFRWWLRGFISEDELDQALAMQRIDSGDVATLKLAAFPLPPVGDLIRMAVREVFSPEIRERFGQDEGFPEEFATFGAQQGISEFWAQAYWAAHWALPSAQQGFEMLHRKVIEPDDLGLLLRALDVMPFWRDKLTAIAFNPLTRVDLRRMHKLGLLDEEQLQLRYEDLGFNPENAAMMVAFTLAYNAEEPPIEPGELEGLTRATTLSMFEDGIISRAQTAEVLLSLGFGEDGTELFITQRELEIERAERHAVIGLVTDQARAGAITFEEAQDRLGEMGLEPAELAKAVGRLLREQERQTSIPPRGDLDKMLAAELISDAAYIDALQRRGFTRFWAENYLALTRAS